MQSHSECLMTSQRVVSSRWFLYSTVKHYIDNNI